METSFKDVSTQSVRFVKPAELGKGNSIVGTFVESYEGQYGLNHKFTDDQGGTFIVNGAGKLNWLIAKVTPGSLCKIVYLGKSPIKDGKMKGKEAHDFQVLVAENTSPAPKAATTTSSVKEAAASTGDSFFDEADALLNSIKN